MHFTRLMRILKKMLYVFVAIVLSISWISAFIIFIPTGKTYQKLLINFIISYIVDGRPKNDLEEFCQKVTKKIYTDYDMILGKVVVALSTMMTMTLFIVTFYYLCRFLWRTKNILCAPPAEAAVPRNNQQVHQRDDTIDLDEMALPGPPENEYV